MERRTLGQQSGHLLPQIEPSDLVRDGDADHLGEVDRRMATGCQMFADPIIEAFVCAPPRIAQSVVAGPSSSSDAIDSKVERTCLTSSWSSVNAPPHATWANSASGPLTS